MEAGRLTGEQAEVEREGGTVVRWCGGTAVRRYGSTAVELWATETK